MNTQTDQELLRDYAEGQSQMAFAELVRRHVDLVHSAAIRMVCDAHTAKDVTQGVFVLLGQHARQLVDRPALAGWLHGTARNLAAKTVRTDVRRRAREQEAAVMNQLLSVDSDASWEHIAPHLDAALGDLSEPDRDAVLLRYFKNHDLRTVGATLGISDDAAQKRVSRAVERLRELFAKRGITVGASGLAVVISANAVKAAPAGLALAISTAAALTGTALATTATVTATKAIAMTALQKTIVTATMAVLAAAGIYEARQASQLRDQVQMLQQQQTPLTEQIEKLQHEKDAAMNEKVLLKEKLAKIQDNNNELLRLRGENTRLRGLATLEQDNLSLQRRVSQLESLWQNVTNSPQFKMPYFEKALWTERGNGEPLDALLSVANAISNGDTKRLEELLVRELGNQSLFTKEYWGGIKGIQVVNIDQINERNGQQSGIVQTVLQREMTENAAPGTPESISALEDLRRTRQTVIRWLLARTENGWQLTGAN